MDVAGDRELSSECPKCGKKVERNANSRFCINCGADLYAAPQAERCQRCGALLSANAEVCRSCKRKRIIKIAVVVTTAVIIATITFIGVWIAVTPDPEVTYSVICYDEETGEQIRVPEEGSGNRGASIMRTAPAIDGYTISFSRADGARQEGVSASKAILTLGASDDDNNVIEFYYKKQPEKTEASTGAASSDAVVNAETLTQASGAGNDDHRTGGNTRFGCSQLYNGQLFIGDLRTNSGDKRINGIPNSEEPPVSVEHFLFNDGVYYYIENYPGNGSGSVDLHAVDLKTDEDVVLAEDVLAPTTAMYDNGTIVYCSYNRGKGKGISAIDVASKKKLKLTDGSKWLLGVYGGYCYATEGVQKSDEAVISKYPLDGGKPETVLTVSADASIIGMYGNVLLAMKSNSCIAYSLDGKKLWEKEISEGLSSWTIAPKSYYEDGLLYYPVEPAITNEDNRYEPKTIACLSIDDGNVTQYKTDLPIIISIVYANEKMIYFCAKEDSSYESMLNGSFSTYVCSRDTGIVTKLGEQA